MFALYVLRPDTAIQTIIRTVRNHSVLRVNHERHTVFTIDQLFWSDCRSFTATKLYVCQETILCFFGST